MNDDALQVKLSARVSDARRKHRCGGLASIRSPALLLGLAGMCLALTAISVAANKSQTQNADDAALAAQGQKLYEAGKYREALPLATEAVRRAKANAKKQPIEYATSLDNLATLYQSMSDYSKAELLYQEAIAIRKELLGEKHPDYAQSLNNLAELYRATGNYAKAESLYRQALAICGDVLGEKHPHYAASLNNLALLYCAMGDYAKAEPVYRRAIEIQKEALGEKHPDYAASLNNLAVLYWWMGDYMRAEPLCRHALAIRKETLGEKHADYAANLNNLAWLYYSMGDYTRAEAFYRQASETLKNALGENHHEYAKNLGGLARLYHSMGDNTRAKSLYLQACEILKTVLGEKHPDYASNLNNLAMQYAAMGDYTTAEPLYRRAMEIQKDALGEKHPNYGASLNNLADLYRSMSDYAKSESSCRQAMAISKAAFGEKHSSYATSLNNLAKLYEVMGDYTTAEPLYSQVASIAADIGEPQSASTFRFNRAECLRLMGRTRESLSEFEEGTRLFEEVRGRIGEGERRSLFQTARGDYHDSYAAALMTEGQYGPAFETLERGRAKSLLDLLATRAVRREGDAGQKSTEVQKLEVQLARMRGEESQSVFAPETPAGAKTRGRRDALTTRIMELDRRRLELIEEIRRVDPEQGALLTVDSPKLAEIQALLGSSVTLVEYWHPGPLRYSGNEIRDELWVFVLRGDELTHAAIDVPQEKLVEALKRYASLTEDASSPRDEVSSASAFLYRCLVDPVLGKLGDGPVIVVPWGAMHKIPVGALAPRGGEPWGARRSIVVTPVAGLYRYVVKKRASGRKSVFALGNPETELTPLPGAELEVAEISSLFQQAIVKTRREATKSLLRSAIGPGHMPDVVHLACHGVFNKCVPQLSYLALTPEKDDSGRLEMHEVYGLDWRGVSLVTLSACSSGKASLGAGNDIIGLVRGFIFAGAPSVLCSLWDVDDEATQALMTRFYKAYLTGKSKPEALREAQTAVRDDPRHPEWKHPYYWAAFVLYGDWM